MSGLFNEQNSVAKLNRSFDCLSLSQDNSTSYSNNLEIPKAPSLRYSYPSPSNITCRPQHNSAMKTKKKSSCNKLLLPQAQRIADTSNASTEHES